MSRYHDIGQDTVHSKVVIEDTGRVAAVKSGATKDTLFDAFSYHAQGGIVCGNFTTALDPANPVDGQLIFDTTLSKLKVWTGAAWETITSV